MKVKFITYISNLELEPDSKFRSENFIYTNKSEDLKKGDDKSLPFLIGSIEYKRLSIDPIVYYVGDLINIAHINHMGNKDLILDFIKGKVHGPISCLWFVKDNAVSIVNYFLIFVTEGRLKSDKSKNFLSNASGTFAPIFFSTKEFQKAIDLKPLIIKHFIKGVAEVSIVPKESNSTIRNTAQHYVIYGDYNRLQRAYLFLEQARMSSILTLKIANYIIILECLFSIQGERYITKNVTHRTSSFIASALSITISLILFFKTDIALLIEFVVSSLPLTICLTESHFCGLIK